MPEWVQAILWGAAAIGGAVIILAVLGRIAVELFLGDFL